MSEFNLSNRIILYAICASIEYDIKRFISQGSEIELPEDIVEKAYKRTNKEHLSLKDTLHELDLGDYISIIKTNPYTLSINMSKVKVLEDYFLKIIPIRNRVMHTRPLEIGDRAILFEVLNQVDKSLNWIEWKETKSTREIISKNPIKLFEKATLIPRNYADSVFHNLPTPEFDDTGYIGRKTDIKQIHKLLKNNTHQVISIVGNGGLGKTALTVKVLYDLMDDPDNKFKAFLWISLKTRTLSHGEFKLINNAIVEIADVYSELETKTGSDINKSSKENILEFMEEFKTLLVLDNLETINSEEIMEFLKSIPEESKVLITSRHGIGELENRHSLVGLNSNDSLTYFRELSKYYGLEIYKESDDYLKNLIQKELYSNPLSIKWFITGLFKGLSIESLINNKGDLIEFCMSNVYEKISESSKEILQLFLIEKLELSIGEIDYYVDIDEVELRKSINELLSTNMVSLKANGYSLNEMAKEYLSLYHQPSNEFMIGIMNKRKHLSALMQRISTMNENDPFNPKSLFRNMESKDRKIASYYLMEALSKSARQEWTAAFDFVNKAANISPNYFEVYKIRAFIQSNNNDFYGAMSSYEIAIEKSEKAFERATIIHMFSIFHVLKLEDYETALSLIEEANDCAPNNFSILIEKARIFMYLGKFQESRNLLEEIIESEFDLNDRNQNLLNSRFAELFRREAEQYTNRDADKKIDLLKQAIEKLEELDHIDKKSYVVFLSILTDLSFLYFNETAINIISQKLEEHFSQLKSINHKNKKKMRDNILNHEHEIPTELYRVMKKYLLDYKEIAKMIENKNEGIVVFFKDHFGFINNAHSDSIYFNVNNIEPGIEVGDKVTFTIYDNKQGIAAKAVKKIIDDEDSVEF